MPFHALWIGTQGGKEKSDLLMRLGQFQPEEFFENSGQKFLEKVNLDALQKHHDYHFIYNNFLKIRRIHFVKIRIFSDLSEFLKIVSRALRDRTLIF